MKRKLTQLEEQFVKEAEEGSFTVHYTEKGTPYAMGAVKTGNLFSMEVQESLEPDRESSVYFL